MFDLAAEVNRLNSNSANFSVNFIPWLQSSPNGLVYRGGIRLPSGRIPTVADVAQNASLSSANVESQGVNELSQILQEILSNKTFLKLMAANVFKAHKEFLDTGLGGLGGDDWSELAYLHNYLGYNLNHTFSFFNKFGITPGDSFWDFLLVIYPNRYAFSILTCPDTETNISQQRLGRPSTADFRDYPPPSIR